MVPCEIVKRGERKKRELVGWVPEEGPLAPFTILPLVSKGRHEEKIAALEHK